MAITQVSDTFTRADNASTAGNTETGQAWSAASGTWGISNNQIYNIEGVGERWVSVESRVLDCTIEAKINVLGDAGIWFRSNGSVGTGWFFNHSGIGWELYKVGSGLQGAGADTPAPGDVMKVVLNKNNIKCYANDVLMVEVNDSAFNGNYYHGFRINNSNNVRFDNFLITTPGIEAAPSVIPTITNIANISGGIRVTFDGPVVDNAALRSVSNYTISGGSVPITINSVVPQSVSQPTYVDLMTSEAKTGVSYTLNIHVIQLVGEE